MFDHIVLRRAERGTPISFGRIVEALLYYQRVHVVIDRDTLFSLVKQIGPSGILTLFSRADIAAVYCEEMVGVATNQIGPLQAHSLVAMTLSGNVEKGDLKTPEDRITFELERRQIDRKVARKFAKQFLRKVPLRRLSGNHFLTGGIPASAKADVLQNGFATQAVRRLLIDSEAGYDPGDSLKFEVKESELGLYVFHNIDLDGINSRRAEFFKSSEPLTIAFFLARIQDATADLAISSFYSGDFVTSDIISEIIKIRHGELLRRNGLNVEAREQFSEVVLPDSPTISEVVDSGERNFKEALTLVDQAMRFKNWLANVSPDEGLVRTYLRDVTKEGWAQRLPAKTLRYALSLGLDATYPTAGVAAGFVDNFILDKLLGGWKPNHFVEKRLAPFIKS